MKNKILIALFILLNFTFCKQDDVTNLDTYNIDGFTNSSDFIVSNLKWDKSIVSFGFTSDFPEKYKEAVRNAFQTWDKVISINFSETQNPDINIIMGDLAHGGCPVDFSNATLAHGCMNDPEKWGNFAGDLHFNKNHQWSTSNSINKNEIDVETIALHEIGHILGLEHSLNNNSVLFAYYTKGSIKRTLTSDDIDGIRELYSAITVPDVVTFDISNITQTSAKIYGNVISENGSSIINRGVCWSINNNPTVSNETKEENSGIGNYTVNLTNLSSNTTYFVRAYAKNSAGVGYGASMSFKTNQTADQTQISTIPISSITQNSAQTGGNITSDGGATISSRGVCWSTNQNPTISDYHTDNGIGSGSFNSSITNLNPNTTYYVRSYAKNGIGIYYGNQLSFTTVTQNNSLKIGDLYGGGIVYYIDATGQHGLILAPNDQDNGRGARWGCNSIEIDGADNKNYLSGYQNTNDILKSCSESGSAASLCFNLSLNGYNDWVLPSEVELTLMHDIYKKGIGNLIDEAYWSSTESNANKAVAFWISENEQLISSKTYTYKVRAIRYF